MKGSVTGVDDLIRKLKRFGADAERLLKAEIAAIGFQIEGDAKQNASAIPNAPAEVVQMINTELSNNGLTAKVSQNALPMGAYIEFGTGVYVHVAPEWKDMAWQFFVNGKGRLRAHPYMYPAFIKGKDDFMATLNKKIEVLSKKFSTR